MHTSRRLEVILKLTEVCNIACTYCYYFFSGDDRPSERPAKLEISTIEGLVKFVNEGFEQGHFDTVQVDLHGGEPLMIGLQRFSGLCETLCTEVFAPTRLCVTTNAMLVNERWVDLFEKYSINTCVSVDGDAAVHDRYRVDKRGRGTHAQVIAGLKVLNRAASDGRIQAPAVLCVVDPASEPVEVYHYLTRTLGITTLDFLMPDQTHETAVSTLEVAAWMTSALAAWLDDDDAKIRVRTFNSVLALLVSGRTYLSGFGGDQPLVMTVGSNGEVDLDDFLKPCGVDVIATRKNIKSTNFTEIFRTEEVLSLNAAMNQIPDACRDCEFAGVCRGGQATHRYHTETGFNNPSVYCEAQRGMFRTAAAHLIATGVEPELIAKNCLHIPAQAKVRQHA